MARLDVGVRIDNLNRVIRAMRQAGDDLSDLKDTNTQIGQIVLNYASGLVPTSDGILKSTGRATGTPREANVRYGYARVPYAGVTHFGTPSGYHEPHRGRPRKQAEHPWLYKAAKDTEPVWGDMYWKALEKAIDRVIAAGD